MKKSQDTQSVSVGPKDSKTSVAVDADKTHVEASVDVIAGDEHDCFVSLGPLLKHWNDEHRDLAQSIRETTLWLGQVSQRGIPRFGELAERLSQMRRRMKQHFDREETLGGDLQRASDCLEIKSTRQRALNDHQHLTQRVDDLIARLSELEPQFESFQQAIDQVGLFVDAFEQHEEQEAQGLQWLTNFNSDPRRLPR